MDFPEPTLQIILSLLLLLVRPAKFSDESRVFGKSGDIHAEESTVADPHHGPEVVYPVEAAHVGGEEAELTRRVV